MTAARDATEASRAAVTKEPGLVMVTPASRPREDLRSIGAIGVCLGPVIRVAMLASHDDRTENRSSVRYAGPALGMTR